MNKDSTIPILDGIRYFYSKSETCNFVPRIEITTIDEVISPILQMAAEKAMIRYRIFRLIVKNNENSYYLMDNNKPPVVHIDDGKRHIVGTPENNEHLTWIGLKDNTIIIEFFHGISDLHGTLHISGVCR